MLVATSDAFDLNILGLILVYVCDVHDKREVCILLSVFIAGGHKDSIIRQDIAHSVASGSQQRESFLFVLATKINKVLLLIDNE